MWVVDCVSDVVKTNYYIFQSVGTSCPYHTLLHLIHIYIFIYNICVYIYTVSLNVIHITPYKHNTYMIYMHISNIYIYIYTPFHWMKYDHWRSIFFGRVFLFGREILFPFPGTFKIRLLNIHLAFNGRCRNNKLLPTFTNQKYINIYIYLYIEKYIYICIYI